MTEAVSVQLSGGYIGGFGGVSRIGGLGPIGFDTLATEIWDASSEGFYTRAAGPAAVLLVLSAATVAVLLRNEEGAR